MDVSAWEREKATETETGNNAMTSTSNEQQKDEQKIRDNVKCCACGGSIANSIHFVCLAKLANWVFPTWGNPALIALGGAWGFASAIVCDKCIREKAEIKFAVQWDDGVLNVKYHPVEKLEDIPALIGVAS